MGVTEFFCIGAAAGLVLWAPIGAVVGYMARGRAIEGAGLGFLLGPFGLLIIFALKDFRRRCQACQKIVPNYEATVCYHCHSPIPAEVKPSAELPGGKSIASGIGVGSAVFFVSWIVAQAFIDDRTTSYAWILIPGAIIAVLLGVLAWRQSLKTERLSGQSPRTPWG